MNKRILVGLLAGLMLFSVACGGKEETREVEEPVVEEGQEEIIDEESEEIVEDNWLEDLNTVDLDGEEVTAELFKGSELTLINGWATWCPPCIAEIPFLEELSNEYDESEVAIKGLIIEQDKQGIIAGLTDEEREVVKEVIDDLGMTYQQLLVSEDLLGTSFTRIMSFPTTYFVDGEGKFVGNPLEGARPKEEWEKVIEERLEMVRDAE